MRDDAHSSPESLAGLIENAPDGIRSVDCEGTILWANTAELTSLGYERGEYVGHHISEFHVEAGGIGDILSRLAAGEAIVDRPASIRCRNGAVSHVVIHSNGRYRDGTLIHSRPAEGLPASRRVLVVDDNEAVVDSLGFLIEMLGNQVRTASDGIEALAVAEEFRPDIVLMDLGMPRMSGFEAAGHMRARPWGARVKLVALTGWNDDADKQRTRDAGFDLHLVKPAKAADLKRLLAG